MKKAAEAAGVYRREMKASNLVKWLKEGYELGHGHSMAIWAVWKDKGWVAAPKSKRV